MLFHDNYLRQMAFCRKRKTIGVFFYPSVSGMGIIALKEGVVNTFWKICERYFFHKVMRRILLSFFKINKKRLT